MGSIFEGNVAKKKILRNECNPNYEREREWQKRRKYVERDIRKKNKETKKEKKARKKKGERVEKTFENLSF